MTELYREPLKIELDGARLHVNGAPHPSSVRKLGQMQEVLMQHVEPKSEEDFNTYWMYRKVFFSHNIRFDITLLPARMLGGEYMKTYGHYHPKAQDESGLGYPEIYQVLKGKAIFVLQEKNKDGSVNVTVQDANEGDIVMMPPGNGHVTVNNGMENLILSNLVYDNFESEYEDYKLYRGAAFYATEEGLKQNTEYLVKKFSRTTASEFIKKYGITVKDLLKEFHSNPEKFAFLEKPGLLFGR
ncbi:TPA: glucose-6-phosphate isomerase [Candidatus Micrarchaeota archaeon]|nr:glucose-6-phosphate isomerase [Candidatus Micrarchaeota archaeon]